MCIKIFSITFYLETSEFISNAFVFNLKKMPYAHKINLPICSKKNNHERL